jgi:aminopeptidase N
VETVSEELDSSDQKSFQEAGVPAVQLFTGPHLDYHRPTDTSDKIDPEGLVKVVSVAREVTEYLAQRQESLTAAVSSEANSGTAQRTERKVSLGIIPDFAYAGKGCRLSGVVPGSPAEKAGLKEGDIIIRMNSTVINKLKDLSDILKSMSAGVKVSLTFLREGNEQSAEVRLGEK